MAISHIAEHIDVDIIVLCEPGETKDLTLNALQRNVSEQFSTPYSNSTKYFQSYVRADKHDLTELHKGRRSSYTSLALTETNLILGFVHGPDLRNYDLESRQSYAERLGAEIRFVISEKKNTKVILLGDFNMNPYDRAMNLASGLNAMSTKECVQAKVRTHMGEKYDFYYNPMWNLLGDDTSGPAGTIYDTSNQGSYGWSTFDQVLFHHSTLEYYQDVEILTEVDGLALTNQHGRPNSDEFSDHFPLLISLREN